MMKNSVKKTLVLAVCIFSLLLGTIKAYAYFTTYVRVKGSKPVKLSESVRFKEEESDSGDKHLVISVPDDSDPVFVRVLVLATDDIMERISYGPEGYEEHWTEEDDGYIYYDEVLMPGDSVELEIDIDKEGLEKDDFEVVVIYEYAPAIYDGENWTVDWEGTQELDNEDDGGDEGENG